MRFLLSRISSALRFIIPIVLVVGLLGCTPSGPRIVAVSGQALHQGKPLPNLFINLKPAQGRPGWTMTDAQGKFEVEYSRNQKGMLIGEYLAWVVASNGTLEEEMATLQGQAAAKSVEMKTVLEKYGSEANALKISITGPNSDLKLNFD